MSQSKQNVIRYCKSKKLALCMPTQASREIIVTDYSSGFGKHIAEGYKWAEIERQLVAWQRAQFGL